MQFYLTHDDTNIFRFCGKEFDKRMNIQRYCEYRDFYAKIGKNIKSYDFGYIEHVQYDRDFLLAANNLFILRAEIHPSKQNDLTFQLLFKKNKSIKIKIILILIQDQSHHLMFYKQIFQFYYVSYKYFQVNIQMG